MTKEKQLNDEQIKHMVNRFLGWQLPENFSPDDGISFNPEWNAEYNATQGKPPARRQPSGTNLFDATQAEAMVRYMAEGMPASVNETIRALVRDNKALTEGLQRIDAGEDDPQAIAKTTLDRPSWQHLYE